MPCLVLVMDGEVLVTCMGAEFMRKHRDDWWHLERKESFGSQVMAVTGKGQGMVAPLGSVLAFYALRSDRGTKKLSQLAKRTSGKRSSHGKAEYCRVVVIPMLSKKDCLRPAADIAWAFGRLSSLQPQIPATFVREDSWKTWMQSLADKAKEVAKDAGDADDDDEAPALPKRPAFVVPTASETAGQEIAAAVEKAIDAVTVVSETADKKEAAEAAVNPVKAKKPKAGPKEEDSD